MVIKEDEGSKLTDNLVKVIIVCEELPNLVSGVNQDATEVDKMGINLDIYFHNEVSKVHITLDEIFLA